MSTENLTLGVAEACARDHLARMGGWLVRKGDVPGMGMIRSLFDVLRAAGLSVPSAAEFDRCSHAIGPMAVIADGLTPAEMIEAVAHEGEHCGQFWRGEYRDGSTVGATLKGGAAFAWLYLVEPEARVRFEARAYRAGLEVRHALGLPLPSVDDLADVLGRMYAIGPEHTEFARQLLASAHASVSAGVVTTESGREMIAVLRKRGVL